MTPKEFVKNSLPFSECLKIVDEKYSITYRIVNVYNMKGISEANSAKQAWIQARNVIMNNGLHLCL